MTTRTICTQVRPSLVALVALVALAAIGCGGPAGDALERGDRFAAEGNWDEAIAAYQKATVLDPENQDAAAKLAEARRAAANDQLAQARTSEQRGDLAQAVAHGQRAVGYDPDHPAARQGLDQLNRVALDRAEKELDAGNAREVYRLTSAVLAAASDPHQAQHMKRARELDGKVRAVLAKQAFARAGEYAAADMLGNALAELAACLHYRPDYPIAERRYADTARLLRETLRYHVVVGGVRGQGRAAYFASAVYGQSFRDLFDATALLDLVTELPAERAASSPGIALEGNLDGYSFDRRKQRLRRACRYVCGTDVVRNPAREGLRQQLVDRDRQLSRADEDVERARREVDREQRDFDRVDADLRKVEADADEARSRLDRCRSNKEAGRTSSCSSEESRLRSAESRVSSARSRVSSAQNDLSRARSRLSSERDDRDRARRDRDRVRTDLDREPATIEVDRHCDFRYRVDRHEVAAQVTLDVTIHALADRGAEVRYDPLIIESVSQDETWPAYPGRCAEVARADPLELPAESALQRDLAGKLLADLHIRVMAQFVAYRASLLDTARRKREAKDTDAAVEAYVRYVLTWTGHTEHHAEIAPTLEAAKGVPILDRLRQP